MEATVICINKNEFTNKAGKTSYVLELIDFNRRHVHKAFTTKKHYDLINDDFKQEYTGYITFENGYTKFYLPKTEVE